MMRNERGDTIIEVILAGAMLALVTVSSFAIIQRASSGAYDSMERSVVRMQLNGQIELLNYTRDAYSEAYIRGDTITAGSAAQLWQTISSRPSVSAAPSPETCSAPNTAFYIERTTGGTPTYQIGTTNVAATGIPEAGKGLWVAKIDSNSSSPKKKYQEFYVVACWQTTASGEQRMSSVVRLYDPAP